MSSCCTVCASTTLRQLMHEYQCLDFRRCFPVLYIILYRRQNQVSVATAPAPPCPETGTTRRSAAAVGYALDTVRLRYLLRGRSGIIWAQDSASLKSTRLSVERKVRGGYLVNSVSIGD